MPPTMVRVVNTGGTNFRSRYKQNWMTIPAGSEVWVDYGAVVAWLGNPSTKDEGRHRDRETEFKRIRVMHMGARANDVHLWEHMRPQLEVYTPENQRLWMVADDPSGMNTTSADTGSETTDMQVNSLRAEVSALTAALNNLLNNNAKVEADLPPMRPEGSAPSVPVIPGPQSQVDALPHAGAVPPPDQPPTAATTRPPKSTPPASSTPPVDVPKDVKKG